MLDLLLGALFFFLLSPLHATEKAASDYAFDESRWHTDAVLVGNAQKILWEKYGNYYRPQDLHYSWSIAKTINAFIFGIAEREGLIKRSQTLRELLPQWFSLWDTLGLKQIEQWGAPNFFYSPGSITIENLLQMCSGINFFEDYGDHPPSSHTIRMLYGSGQGAIAALSLTRYLSHPPGTHFYYSTGDTNLSQWVMQQVLGQQKYDHYLRDKLFSPLGITDFRIESDARGVMMLGSYVYLKPQDYWKLGKLLLQKGKWEDEQLLSPEWIDFMSTPSQCFKQTHLTGDQFRPYGAGLWTNVYIKEQGSLPTYPFLPQSVVDMKGHGGQTVVIDPENQLTLLRFGKNVFGHHFSMKHFLQLVYQNLGEER